MHIPLPWTKTSRTVLAGAATWFMYGMFIQGLSTCELFRCIFSFYFISAEALKAIKVHVMQIPVAGKDGIMTIGATWFAYVYTGSFNI